MSGTTQHIPPPPAPPASDLDTSVDALVDRIDAAADSASEALDEIAAEVNAHAPVAEVPTHPDDLMSAVAGDIEQIAPGPLTAPPPTAAMDEVSATNVDAPDEPTSPSAMQAPSAVSSAELDDALAAVADDLAEAESAVQTPAPQASHEEAETEFTSPTADELVQPAPAPASAPASPEPRGADRPSPDVRKLDEELAANADRVLAQAQQDLAAAPSASRRPDPPEPEVEAHAPTTVAELSEFVEPPREPAPVPPASVAPAPSPAPGISSAPAPVQARSPEHAEPVPAASLAPAALPVEPKPSFGARLAPALAKVASVALMPLAPLAAVHRKLGEEMRQTIGYCAIMTGFVAACLWVAIPMLKKPHEHTPVTPAAEFYDPSKPAHGVSAPPRHDAAGHGKDAGDHGTAKKDDHGAAKKDDHGAAKKDDHGAAKKDSHGSAKKAEPKKAAAKKADAHGAKKSAKKADAHH